jgi:hypothetical protein
MDMHRAKSPNDAKQSDTIYTNYPPPSSTPPTLTVIFTGNGDIPLAFVINGTAVRPRSDEVWVSIVCNDLDSVDANAVLNVWRSTDGIK